MVVSHARARRAGLKCILRGAHRLCPGRRRRAGRKTRRNSVRVRTVIGTPGTVSFCAPRATADVGDACATAPLAGSRAVSRWEAVPNSSAAGLASAAWSRPTRLCFRVRCHTRTPLVACNNGPCVTGKVPAAAREAAVKAFLKPDKRGKPILRLHGSRGVNWYRRTWDSEHLADEKAAACQAQREQLQATIKEDARRCVSFDLTLHLINLTLHVM